MSGVSLSSAPTSQLQPSGQLRVMLATGPANGLLIHVSFAQALLAEVAVLERAKINAEALIETADAGQKLRAESGVVLDRAQAALQKALWISVAGLVIGLAGFFSFIAGVLL